MTIGTPRTALVLTFAAIAVGGGSCAGCSSEGQGDLDEVVDLGMRLDGPTDVDRGTAVDLWDPPWPDPRPDLAGPPDLKPWPWREVPTGYWDTFHELWGSGPKDVYIAVGKRGILHSPDGQFWHWRWKGAQEWDCCTDISGSGPNDVWALGYLSVQRSVDGGMKWTPAAPPLQVAKGYYVLWQDVWLSGPGDVWIAAGVWRETVHNPEFEKQVICHSTDGGKTWSFQTVGTDIATTLGGTGANNVYLVGVNGMILRSIDRGTSWKRLAVPNPQLSPRFYSMWGSGADDMYVAGEVPEGLQPAEALLLHSVDGNSWKPIPIPVSLSRLANVWGSHAADVYITSYGTIFRSTDGGGKWSVDYEAKGNSFVGDVWGTGPNDVYALLDDQGQRVLRKP